MARKKNASSSQASTNRTSLATFENTRTTIPALVSQAIASITALSLATYAAQVQLAPLFGSVATNLYLQTVVTALILSLSFVPTLRNVRFPSTSVQSVLICSAPPVIHLLATLTARLRDPQVGPVLAYGPVLFAIVYLTVDTTRRLTSVMPIGNSVSGKAITGIATSSVVMQSQRLWSAIPYYRVLSQPMLLVASGWIVAASGLSASPSSRNYQMKPAKQLFPVLLATFIALALPPLRPHSLPYNHPSGSLRILASNPSLTGRIVVGEDLDHGFRFLRADHSLLGGVWIGDDKTIKMSTDAEFAQDKDGVKLGDSIYSAFVLQEAVRLQEWAEAQTNALVIGLGVGIAAQSFMQHGLATSIIEIDPAVYNAARDYFGVPEPTAAYIADARSWVARRAAMGNETYDIVVHDCFSGGGVPAHLFTTEFWEDLKKIVSPEGVVAVNYAGIVGSDPSKAVLITLLKSFVQCRVFHDYHLDMSDEKLTSEFINVVFFCTPSHKPLTFRPAQKEDYLSSYLREHVLSALPSREVRLDLIRGEIVPGSESEWVLTDSRNPLGAWQDKGALDHWRVMRNVLPDIVWETY